MPKIVYHADLNEAQGDPALAALPAVRGPFDRLDWMDLLASECLPERKPVVAIVSANGAAAVLPLMTDGPRRLSGLANWYSFWLRPLGSAALLPDLAASLRDKADAISLRNVPAEDLPDLTQAFRTSGWLPVVSRCDFNYFLKVEGRSFAEYWASRPGKLREIVRRKGRKNIVSLRIAREFSERDWADYEAIYRRSWKPGEGSPAFLRRFAMIEGEAGRLRLGIATIEGAPVAAQFWTVEAGTAFIHKLAHDEEARTHSPGSLLSAAMFEHVIDRDKVGEIDFGTGNDAYKRDWMEDCRERFAIDLYRIAAPRAWPLIVRALAGRLCQSLLK